MKQLFLFIFILFLSKTLTASEDIRYEDFTYVDYIRTVQLYGNEVTRAVLPVGTFSIPSLPSLVLGQRNQLTLSFDELRQSGNSYYYSFIHCNADWTPSVLSELEYIEGFTEDRIVNFQSSFNTISNYQHFEIAFPNENIKLKKSGNYIIKVYDSQGNIMITRRFWILERLLNLDISHLPGSRSLDKNQEIFFTASFKNLILRNPMTEIKATVLQNYRWDNAMTGIPPARPAINDKLEFNQLGTILFPAGNEFRWLNLIYIFQKNAFMNFFIRDKNGYFAELKPEKERSDSPYFQDKDLSGRYVIEQQNTTNTTGVSFLSGNRVLGNTAFDSQLYQEYVRVRFILNMKERSNEDVYVMGAFCDWQPYDENKMTYNSETHMYEAEILLKQGFYNYMYATRPKGKNIDTSALEGDWYETENAYTVLVYYRPFGERYDRLIGEGNYQTRRF